MLTSTVEVFHLAAAAKCSPPTAESAFRQGDVLDDLGEVQVDLQQQVLAPLTHRTERQRQHGEYSHQVKHLAQPEISLKGPNIGKIHFTTVFWQ